MPDIPDPVTDTEPEPEPEEPEEKPKLGNGASKWLIEDHFDPEGDDKERYEKEGGGGDS